MKISSTETFPPSIIYLALMLLFHYDSNEYPLSKCDHDAEFHPNETSTKSKIQPNQNPKSSDNKNNKNMEALTQSVTAAIQSSDYPQLSLVFTSQWQSLGQGEQRTLAAHFIKSAVASTTFLPDAFKNAQMMTVITTTLGHLPPTVDGAADNVLRQRIFDYKVNEEEDYSTAAQILSGLRMETNEGSVYYMTPIERCDVFVKVAECYLEEDLTVEAEGAVTKAGTIIETSGISFKTNDDDDDDNNNDGDDNKAKNKTDEQTMTLLLRYKSTYARILDANRKFLNAAMKYHDLSTAYKYTDAIDEEDLLIMLGKAVTCAILSPNSAQRQR